MKFQTSTKKPWAPALVVPEEVRAWRSYADPINQRIMERWKDGEPRDRQQPPKPINLKKIRELQQANEQRKLNHDWKTI
jgi:hypothetical protein